MSHDSRARNVSATDYAHFMTKRYNRLRHSVFNIKFHIIFCPKYRKPFLLRYKQDILSCFRRSCILNHCLLREAEIMPDHVHLFVSIKRSGTFVFKKLIQHLKGWSSFFIRKKNKWMRKYKAFWASSYFAESIGHISEPTIRKYIQNQTTDMKENYRYKSLVNRLKQIPSLHNHRSHDAKSNHNASPPTSGRAVVQGVQSIDTQCKTRLQYRTLLQIGVTKTPVFYKFRRCSVGTKRHQFIRTTD